MIKINPLGTKDVNNAKEGTNETRKKDNDDTLTQISSLGGKD
jgi:hypothetical protein